jgi:SAM-dependent methyltransferase
MSAEEPVRHRWEDWTWDETVFQGTVAYYRQGRKPYAAALAIALAEQLDLDGHGRLLDVGYGPGTVALFFAHLFESVVGLDPDPEMVADAKLAATEAQVAKAIWVQMRAEELPPRASASRLAAISGSELRDGWRGIAPCRAHHSSNQRTASIDTGTDSVVVNA